MSRFLGILAVLAVVLLAMGFAAANAGHRVAIDLGLFTLYRVPVTLVAFSGLLVGMVVMFATGVHTDLKVRRILRDRLAEETQVEQRWIDASQQDLFAGAGAEMKPESGLASESPVEVQRASTPRFSAEVASDPGPAFPVEVGSDPGPAFPVEVGSDPGPAFPVEVESDQTPESLVEFDSDPVPEFPVEFDSHPTPEFPFDEEELKE